MSDADLLVFGRILPSPTSPVKRALAVGAGRVLAVGTEAQAERWRGRHTKVWRLKRDQVVVPGFVDSHAHLAADAWRRTWVELGGCDSLEEALERLRAAGQRVPPGAWMIARGWDESAWPERRYLSRRDLDTVSRRRPVLANRVDGHMCSVNTIAWRRAKLSAKDAGVRVDAAGRPTGVLTEAAASRARAAIPRPSDSEYSSLLADAIANVHRLGVTGVHDIVGASHLRAYQHLRRAGDLALRVYLMPYDELLDPLLASGLRTGFGDEWLRLGAIKVFADGSLGARTAALSRPYADGPGRGGLIHRQKGLRARLLRANEAGFQLAVHAIGDRGVDAVVDALEYALDREPREDHRHRIEHFELPSEEALDRVADLDIIASMQPNFVRRWSRPGGLYDQRLGDGRLAGNNPYRTILSKDIPIAFGSDGMPYGPLFGLGGATDAPFPEQRIRGRDAMGCYTLGGAFASFSEGQGGRLAPGTFADFAVLSGDPRTTPSADLSVDATAVGGKAVYLRKSPG